ncbi:kelch repeat-containing protein [Myxococcaceae bacterium GXIMD 01537]
MRHHSLRFLSLAAALGLAPACGEQETVAQLQLVTQACAGPSPMEGVTHLLMRVTGEGLDAPIDRVTTNQWRPEDVPRLPAGKARVLEVRAYVGYPDAGTLVSLGRTAPFDVPEEGTAPVDVRIFLRRVGSLVPPSRAESPLECQSLVDGPRAAHTATLLKDGRVLLAGGYREDKGGTVTLASSEVFDPATGALSAGPPLTGRAFHTATSMPDGRVLLAGGERLSDAGSVRLSDAALVDVAASTSETRELRMARSRHSAAADASGHVLLVGGVGEGGAVLSTAEGLDAAGQGFAVPTALPRVGAAVVSLDDGQRLAVVGGSDGVALQPDILAFAFDGSTFAPQGSVGVLTEPRRNAAVTFFEDARRFVVSGGYRVAAEPTDGVQPLASSEMHSPEAARGPSIAARGDACAVTLPDGRVVLAGGRVRFVDLDSRKVSLISSGEVELMVASGSPTSATLGFGLLEEPRYLHTCTALPDGTVLIAGGLNDTVAEQRFTETVFIFTPPPAP